MSSSWSSGSRSAYRGRGRGLSRGGTSRGGGRGAGASQGSWSRNDYPKPPTGPFGLIIDSFDVNELLIEVDTPSISGVEYVASYNWLAGPTPIILVPGSPPRWNPPPEDKKLNQDAGDFYRDVNAAHYPDFPLEPTLRSVFALRPNFELSSIDIIGCGSTIGNLLRFASSQSKPFRFDVDVIGETIVFTRREISPTQLIEHVKGYGHTFPDHYTSWEKDTRGSVSHQRIIRYDFGGLRFLLRTETDGYVKDPTTTTAKESSSQSTSIKGGLEEVLKTMKVTSQAPSGGQKIQLKLQGGEIRQDQIFDIKTRACYNPFEMEEILPRLWVNQTSKFLLAYHEFGLFNRPKVKDVTKLVADWQTNNSTILGRFHAVVSRIMDVMREAEHQQAEVSWDGEGSLMITKQIGAGRRALPADLRGK